MNVIQRRSSSTFSLSLPHFLALSLSFLLTRSLSLSFSLVLAFLFILSFTRTLSRSFSLSLSRFLSLSFFLFLYFPCIHALLHALCLDVSLCLFARIHDTHLRMRAAAARARACAHKREHSRSTHLNGRSFARNVFFFDS